MGETFKLDEAEVKYHLDALNQAREEIRPHREKREKGERAYSRKLFGNEKKNRSKFVASTARNQTQAMLRQLVKRHVGADHKLTIKGPDATIAKALKKEIRSKINDQGGFRLIHDAVLNAGVSNNGTTKLWWSRVWDTPVLEMYEEVTREELDALLADTELRIPENKIALNEPRVMSVVGEDGLQEMTVEAAPTFRCAGERTRLLESGLVIENLAPEEFLPARGKVSMQDTKPVWHVRKMLAGELIKMHKRLSMPGAPYFSNLKAAISAAPGAKSAIADESDNERIERERLHYDPKNDGLFGSEITDEMLRVECTVGEEYAMVAKGGELVRAVITWCNDVPIRCEKNEEGIVPMATWSPFLDPNSILGTGVAYDAAYDNDVQTVLTRSLLDGLVMSIDRPRAVSDLSADLLGLQDLYPGKLVRARKGDWEDLGTEPPDARIFQVVEHLKQEREEAGPGTRMTQGVDDSSSRTATEATIMQSGAMSKTDLMSMCFTELWLVPVYNIAVHLYQANLDRPVVVEVDGQQVELTRDNIQGDYRAVADLGLEINFDERRYAQAQAQVALMMQMAQTFPMLFPLEKVREHLRQVYVEGAAPDVNALLGEVPPGMEGWMLGTPIPGTPVVGPDGQPLIGPDGQPMVHPPMGGATPSQPGQETMGNATSAPDEALLGV